MISFEIVVAVDRNFGIGKEGHLPWKLPGDMRHFKELTSRTALPSQKNAVIMGRKTWESIPAQFRPLPGRVNLVLSRSKALLLPPGVLKAESLDEALRILNTAASQKEIDKVFVIGGSQVFQAALRHPACSRIHLTQILAEFPCDAFFPPIPEDFIELCTTKYRKSKKTKQNIDYHNAIGKRKVNKSQLTSPRHSDNSIEYYFVKFYREKS